MLGPESRVRRVASKIEDSVLSFFVDIKKKTRKQDYKKKPDVSAIVQTFNKRRNVKEIISRLRASGVNEIILIDDGSIDGTTRKAKKELNEPNEFLIRSHDLHEVIMYKRAIRFSSGELICLLQDDDFPPRNPKWITNAKKLFQEHQKLLVLGGKNGQHLKIPDPPPNNGTAEYSRDGNEAGMPGVNKYEVIQKPSYKNPALGIPFEFVSCVHRAPIFLRREEFMEMGSIDLEFAPFQCDDIDFCIRAWKNDFKVGLYIPDFIRSDRGGQSLFGLDSHSSQVKRNWKKIYQRYGKKISENRIKKKAQKSNQALT
jgi:glycosyltransferase involved in cell wall biosynthesis